jgi:soluble lytic murein transglycosylase-like protein
MRSCHRSNPLFKSVAYGLVAILLGAILLPAVAMAQVPQAAKKYQRDLLRNSQAVWGLNAPTALFAAQIHQESRWNLRAVSPVGAQGLAQVMPATASWLSGRYPDLALAQPFNPNWALRALVQYNRFHYDRINAHQECDRWAFVLSAYNGGLGWVQRDKRLAAQRGLDPLQYWQAVETINAGRSAANFAENRGYPQQIIYRWQPLYLADNWGKGVCL